MAPYPGSVASRLEELDGISVRILDLDLAPRGTALHLVAKAQSDLLQLRDEAGKIGHLQHHPIPAARLLRLSVRERPRAGCARAAEQKLRVAQRDIRKRRELLVSEREPEVLRIERHRASDVLHLIAGPMKSLDEWVLFHIPYFAAIGDDAQADRSDVGSAPDPDRHKFLV